MVLFSAVSILAYVLLARSFSQEVTGRVHAILNRHIYLAKMYLSHIDKILKWMDNFLSFAVRISFSNEKALYLRAQVEDDHLCVYPLVHHNLMKLLVYIWNRL